MGFDYYYYYYYYYYYFWCVIGIFRFGLIGFCFCGFCHASQDREACLKIIDLYLLAFLEMFVILNS